MKPKKKPTAAERKREEEEKKRKEAARQRKAAAQAAGSWFETRPRDEEQPFLESLDQWTGKKILCVSTGWGQIADAVARAQPESQVDCCFLDVYAVEQAQRQSSGQPNLKWHCTSDFPQEEYDLALIPLGRRGESELVRDRLQCAYDRLKVGGVLAAAVDFVDDKWLGHEMDTLGGGKGVRPQVFKRGKMYTLTKTGPLKRMRDFGCEFAFRDEGRLVKAYSRPGVFAHRKLDLGARKLLEAAVVKPGMRVLDLGCGSGAVGVALALRTQPLFVHAVDSCARAIECTQKTAALNGVTVSTELSSEGVQAKVAPFDLALANPPYYSDYRLAQLFLEFSLAALRPRGEVLVVTKLADWYDQHMEKWFDEVVAEEHKDYVVFRGRKPR